MLLRTAWVLLLIAGILCGGENPAPGASPESDARSHKVTDIRHLKEIRAALFAYKKDQGKFPAYLSDLTPKYVAEDVLESPARKQGAQSVSGGLDEHADPKVEPSYGYEFSSKEFRSGRTFAEIKEVQLAEYGHVVPILRCFHHGKVINMSYGGDVYETELNWEVDPATLDLVKKYGWGPGAAGGEGVVVTVLDAAGTPLAGAEVFAAERRANTLWLPDRPFATDAAGKIRIALGPNKGESPLKLTVRARGFAPETRRWSAGNVPAAEEFRLKESLLIGGVVKSDGGAPLQNASIRIYWQKRVNGTLKESLAEDAVSGADGKWWSSAAPPDAESFWFEVSHPDCRSADYEESLDGDAGRKVSRDTLKKEAAVFVLPPPLHLRGTVKDEAGKPVAGAAARYSKPGEPRQKLPKTVTAADGTFHFTIGEDIDLQLIVSAEGFKEHTQKIRFDGRDALVEVTLKRP